MGADGTHPGDRWEWPRRWKDSTRSELKQGRRLERYRWQHPETPPAGLDSELTECSKGSAGTDPTKAVRVQSRRQSRAFLPSEGSNPLPDGTFSAGLSVRRAADSKAEWGWHLNKEMIWRLTPHMETAREWACSGSGPRDQNEAPRHCLWGQAWCRSLPDALLERDTGAGSNCRAETNLAEPPREGGFWDVFAGHKLGVTPSEWGQSKLQRCLNETAPSTALSSHETQMHHGKSSKTPQKVWLDEGNSNLD